MDRLDQLRAAIAALPAGSLVALPREALLDALGALPVESSAESPVESPVRLPVDPTVAQVAEHFGRAPSTIRQWLESGALEGYKLFDREWRIPAAAIAAFQERQRAKRPLLGDWRKVKRSRNPVGNAGGNAG